MYLGTIRIRIFKLLAFVVLTLLELSKSDVVFKSCQCNFSSLFSSFRKKRDGLDRFGSDDEHAQYQRRRISFFKVFVVIHDHLQRGPLDSFADRVLAVDLRRQDGSGP